MADTPRPKHSPMVQFSVTGHCLQVGGMSLTRLAQRVGQTPFFAYDRQLLSDRIRELRRQLPSSLHIHYAIKANPMPALVQHMAQLVDGLDVASAGELRVALDTPMPAECISMAGPGKSERDLSTAIAAGAVVHVESSTEFERIMELSTEMGVPPRVAVRVNPDFELKSSGMKMGGGARPFGMDAEIVPDFLKQVFSHDVEFMGFHLFAGSQNLRVESLKEAQQKTVDLALRLAQEVPGPLKILNMGGGLGIPYFPGEESFDLSQLGPHMEQLLSSIHAVRPETQVVMELGRYLVGEAGIYVCRVVDKKVSRGQTYLVTDGGLHQHLAASGNFGQVIRKNYPVAIGTRMGTQDREEVSIVGPLCTPLDLLADKMELPRAEVGDLVVIFQSGAYGLTASPQGFLSHPAALEVLV